MNVNRPLKLVRLLCYEETCRGGNFGFWLLYDTEFAVTDLFWSMSDSELTHEYYGKVEQKRVSEEMKRVAKEFHQITQE